MSSNDPGAEQQAWLVADQARGSEEQFRALADAIPQLAWMALPDGFIYWYNRRWYEYTGTTPEQMEGWGWQSVHDPDVLPGVLERWRSSIATGQPFEMVFPLRGADGVFRRFLTRVQPVKDAHGRVVRWFGTNTDVDELKRNEEALRESEERYRMLFANMIDGYQFCEIVLDDEGVPVDFVYLDVNASFERLTGLHDVVGKRVSNVIPGIRGSNPELFEIYGRAALEGVAARFETEVPELDRIFDVSVYGVGSGRFVTVFDNITERKRAEEERAELGKAAERELERTRLLLQAADSLASSTSLDVVLDTLTSLTLQVVDHSRVYVSFWDQHTDRLVIAASKGIAPIPRGLEFELSAVSAPARKALTQRTTEFIDFDGLMPGQRGIGERFTSHFALDVPLLYRDHVVGLLAVDDPEERREFTERETELVQGIAAQAAVAIENARLFEAEREAGRFGRSMAAIHTDLASSLDVDETLSQVLQKVGDELDAYGVSVLDRVEGGWRVSHVAGPMYPRGVPTGSVFSDQEAPSLMRVLDIKTPYVVEDVRTETGAERELAHQSGFVALAVYPLVVRDEIVGALSALFSEPRRFSELELDYMRRVAFAISLAEESSRLFQAEHHIAETLQAALLELPETLPGIEFAHAYHSATETARVGGDFYDLFELNHDHVGIVIGDVAGKGIDAAVLTSMVKHTVRAHASERGKTPAQILKLTNDLVYKSTPTEAFVTLFLGILECRDGRLVYGNAGHTTAAVVRGDGSVSKLSVTGPLLGAFGDVDFGQSEARLGFDALLFLYTDGMTEARRDGELYGEQRVFAQLSRTCDGPPADVVRKVIDDVLEFTGERLQDDLAILAVKRVEQGAEAPHQQKLEM